MEIKRKTISIIDSIILLDSIKRFPKGFTRNKYFEIQNNENNI